MEIIKFDCNKPEKEVKFITKVRRYGKAANIIILVPSIMKYLINCEVEVTIKKR